MNALPVAYQGAPGAFSEDAVRRVFGEETATLPCQDFRDVVGAVSDGRAEYGLLPVENTLAGTIPEVWDLLAENDLVVLGETAQPIRHCLAGLGAGVRRVLSHPVALAQCSRYFRDNPGIEAIAWYDTAGAAREVANRADPAVAALASERAAECYGLTVLQQDLQDSPDNQTRFYVTGRDSAQPLGSGSSARKLTLVVEAENRPGSLLRLLAPLSGHGINLCLLESRPTGVPWTYRFIMECDSTGGEDEAVALEAVRRQATAFRMLGRFPVDAIMSPAPL